MPSGCCTCLSCCLTLTMVKPSMRCLIPSYPPSSSSATHIRRSPGACAVGGAVVPHAYGHTSQDIQADVAVIGGGIIGLCIADELLRTTDHSVCLIERQQPCSGATGAGQGYIWLAHRNPADSRAWGLAMRSKELWEDKMRAGCRLDNTDLHTATQWQDTGSLLLARTTAEAEELEARAALLEQHGVQGRVLSAAEVQHMEPAVALPPEGAALAVASDAQLSGRAASQALLRQCMRSPRFRALMDEPALSLQRAEDGCRISCIHTAHHRVVVAGAAVLAAGAWTGRLLAQVLGEAAWEGMFRPRKGHLICCPRPEGMPALRHGMMELGYTQHYAGQHDASSHAVDITFTASQDTQGHLLLGSSREFAGFDSTPSVAVVRSIVERAASFLPHITRWGLTAARLQELIACTRVGPRPYAVGGAPMIGHADGLTNLVVAAGHEGSGLTLGPATAELTVQAIILSQQGSVQEQ